MHSRPRPAPPAAASAPRRAPRPARPAPLLLARRGEAGVSIVLVFLVLLVLTAVLMELRFNASVELDRAVSLVDAETMRRLADAAAQQAEAALLMDSESAQQSEDGAAAGGDAGGQQGQLGDIAGAAGGGEDKSGASSAASIADTTGSTDSKLDDWSDSAALTPSLGEDWSLCTEIEDEDSKINLLGLWTSDIEVRTQQHDIVRDLLDKAFEGTSRDISFSDATDILDKLDDWVTGARGSFDPVPAPVLKKTNEQDKAAEAGGSLDASAMDAAEHKYPLTLGELLMMPGIRPEHLSGFVEDDKFYPGLESYLTLFSQLELKPKPKEGDNLFSDSPFTKGSLFDKPSIGSKTPGTSGSSGNGGNGDNGGSGQSGGGGGKFGGGTSSGKNASDTGGAAGAASADASSTPGMEDDNFEPTPTNDGLVNINTAPLAVLRAIAPHEIPVSFLEKIVEYRNKVDELKQSLGMGGMGSMFDKAKSGTADDKAGADARTDTGFSKDEEEDITKFVFKTPKEAIDKVQKEYDIELNLDPGVETAFTERLTVTSQVFTIKVLVYKLAQNPGNSRMEFGRRSNWRSVVWRMLGDEMPHVLTLLPLEDFHDPRRLKDYPGNLEQLASDHSQAVSSAGAGR